MTQSTEQPELQSPDAVLHRAAEHLAIQFQGTFNEETVERVVFESYTALARTAKVKNHLSSLATRFAHDRLTALAQAKGAIPKSVPEVLFVCVQNSGRSQMAAGLLRQLAGTRVHVRSAGSEPAPAIEPAVALAMAELGVDLHEEFPKPLTDDVVRAADVVITMGCGDACPVYPGKRYLDWELADPALTDLDGIRDIRDDIKSHVETLIIEIAHVENPA
jgi:protein-tyrosine-phosphatase